MNTQDPHCYLCSYNSQSFQTLIPHSLYNKYSSSQNFYYTKDIDSIMHQQISSAYIQFHQNNYLDQDQQYLKRQYNDAQFDKKINMLSQYYKFHRDLPVWNERSVQILMEKYYNKLKDVDYKKIKQVLKQEQNISLSTHKSFSSFDDSSEITKKSKYSIMLHDLNQTKNQSIFLMELCDKIGRALKKVKGDPLFKGNFISSERKFQEFVKKQNKKKDNYFKKQGSKRNSIGLKKVKFNPKLNTKNDEFQFGLRQINFASNHSIKNRRSKVKSIEKTTANQTISREEKVKIKKDKNILQPNSGRSSLSLRRRTPNSESYKILKTKNIMNLGNQNLKTINQIYKPNQNNELVKKQSNKILSRIRSRSNSHHNIPTTSSRNRENIKLQGRLTRVNSQKFPKSVAKQSIIELQKMNSAERYCKNIPSQKISRSNSIKRMGSMKKIERDSNGSFGKSKGSQFLTQRKNSVIENMLEKKLSVFKKKQPIL